MNWMKLSRISGFCALASGLCFLGAIIRGDFMYASVLTACLVFSFIALGVAAFIFLVLGAVIRRHKAI